MYKWRLHLSQSNSRLTGPKSMQSFTRKHGHKKAKISLNKSPSSRHPCLNNELSCATGSTFGANTSFPAVSKDVTWWQRFRYFAIMSIQHEYAFAIFISFRDFTSQFEICTDFLFYGCVLWNCTNIYIYIYIYNYSSYGFNMPN